MTDREAIRAGSTQRFRLTRKRCAMTVELHTLRRELEGLQGALERQNAAYRKVLDQAETALEKYTDLYNLAPVGLFTLDREGCMRDVNLTFASLMGVARSRLIGGRLGDLVAECSCDCYAAFGRRSFAGHGRASTRLTLLNGADAPVQVQVEAATRDGGWLLALVDITGQHPETTFAGAPAGKGERP